MLDTTRTAAAITPPRVRASAAVRTYRYLRLSLVGLVLLLLLGTVWLERLTRLLPGRRALRCSRAAVRPRHRGGPT